MLGSVSIPGERPAGSAAGWLVIAVWVYTPHVEVEGSWVGIVAFVVGGWGWVSSISERTICRFGIEDFGFKILGSNGSLRRDISVF